MESHDSSSKRVISKPHDLDLPHVIGKDGLNYTSLHVLGKRFKVHGSSLKPIIHDYASKIKHIRAADLADITGAYNIKERLGIKTLKKSAYFYQLDSTISLIEEKLDDVVYSRKVKTKEQVYLLRHPKESTTPLTLIPDSVEAIIAENKKLKEKIIKLEKNVKAYSDTLWTIETAMSALEFRQTDILNTKSELDFDEEEYKKVMAEEAIEQKELFPVFDAEEERLMFLTKLTPIEFVYFKGMTEKEMLYEMINHIVEYRDQQGLIIDGFFEGMVKKMTNKEEFKGNQGQAIISMYNKYEIYRHITVAKPGALREPLN